MAADKSFRPVLISGYRRLFNLRPSHYESSYEISPAGIENGAMNVEPAAGARFNAVAFRVSQEELRDLDQRERYYRRVSAPIDDFDSGKSLGEGYFYSAEPDAPWIERSPERLLPLWRDIVWARAGAYALSPSFCRVFDETTYLADGRTLMVSHYRRLLDRGGDPLQQAASFLEPGPRRGRDGG